MLADWQLPPGVKRGLWEYCNDPAVARSYDAQLVGSPLLEIDQAFVLQHCQPPGRLVDLGCGTGRLSIALAAKGYRCVAVDLSAEMLQVVREKSAAAGVEVECLQANLVELDALPSASFDYAACLFSTLGMIDGRDTRARFLRHVHRLLRPGGRFVVHAHNRWFGLWTPAGRRMVCSNLLGSLLGRHEPGDYLMPPHHGLGRLPMHLFTRRELITALQNAGFHIRELRPIGPGKDPAPRWFSALRSYRFLVAAERPPP